MLRPFFARRKVPKVDFYQRLSGLQCHSAAGIIMSTEKFIELFGNQTYDLPSCNTAMPPLAQ
jgi:hypothetical protein